MADICTCCGKKIPFMDIEYDYIEIDKVEYRLCGKCRSKINDYINEKVSIKEVISDATDEKIVEYMKSIKSDEDIELQRKEKERIESKIIAQKNDPLYDDIHQIAGDLRFIKNIIIICLVCGVILGIIGILWIL